MAAGRKADAPMPPIEQADVIQFNAMVNEAGERFYPTSREAAEFFRVEQSATPVYPDVWPFGEDAGSGPAPEREPFDPLHCPTPDMCFPYGLSPDTSHAACIHGETHA